MTNEKNIAYLKRDVYARNFKIEKIPVPYPVALQIQPGESSIREMFSSVADGVYIVDCKNFWQSLDDENIIYGTIDLGFRLKKGEITGSIKNSHFKLSVTDAFNNNLVNISSDYLGVAEFYNKMPYIQLDQVEIL
jgi:predicted Zn-dependent protease